MPPPLLLLQDIGLTFGAAPLLSGAALAVAAGDRICLVGRNGSGKSTLLRIAAGLLEPDDGERFAQPGARISYLPQEPDLTGFATTLGYVEAGFSAEASDRHRALYLLKELGLSGEEEPGALSGGGSPNCTRCAASERSIGAHQAWLGSKRHRPTCRAGWSRPLSASPNPMPTARSFAISRPGSCAAIGSASSARTAPGKRPCSTCLSGSCHPTPARCGSVPTWPRRSWTSAAK